MKLSDFDYSLPPERIAQHPLDQRDASRMMLLDRRARTWHDCQFRDLPDILRGDELLVVNNARVVPARLFGCRKGVHAGPVALTGRARREFLQSPIEVLLTRQIASEVFEALVRPGRKIRTGERLVFGQGELEAEVVGRGELGLRQLRLIASGNLPETLQRLGHTPLPPYIRRPDAPADRQRYQTIFARVDGAVAAPTAALHFTPVILERLRQRRIPWVEITLQVGLGTFQPIHTECVTDHVMHLERYEIPETSADQINRAHKDRRPILAAGTTVVRALEDAAQKCIARQRTNDDIIVEAGAADAALFIYPRYEFRVITQMLTNFHLPKSSLLVMVAAFAGREFILDAYQHAIASGYRFYSYGDCMLIR